MAAPSGTVWGSIVGSYGKIGIYKSLSSTNTETTLTVEVWFWSKYSVSDTANTLYYDNLSSSGSATTSKGAVSISTTVASGEGWSTSNQKKLATYITKYTRGTSAVTRYLHAKLANVDRVGGTMYASTTVSIPKLASYTVSYNANGGSSAPSSQTKWYGKSLTLSSTKPTRTGYSFQGWATSASGSVAYAAGASYTANAAVTLYAVWKANTYTVKYDANGGTGAPSNQTKTHDKALTLSSTKPTRANYNFKGWGTSASATTVAYAAGASYTGNAALTLYAIWELAYIKPRISNVICERCDSDGTMNEEGTSALVTFDWECDKAISSIVISWKETSGTDWTSETFTASGTSGLFSQATAKGLLDTEITYDFKITVIDSGDSEGTSATDTIASLEQLIDCLPMNKGIAFGKTAEFEGVAEFEFEGKFNSPVYGKALGMDRLPQIPANSSLNDYMEPGCYAIYGNADAATIYCKEGALMGSADGIPPARAGRLEVWSSTGEGIRAAQWSYLRQRFVPYNSANAVWEREITRNADNVWTYYDWWRSTLTPAASEKVYDEPVILFDGNSAGTITLSDSADNYEYLEIFFTDNNGEKGGYTKIHKPFTAVLDLNIIEAAGTNTYIRRTNYSISGKTITPDTTNAGYARLNGTAVTHTSGTNYIKITRVLGRND